jgi:multiple sugar transport system permease protein
LPGKSKRHFRSIEKKKAFWGWMFVLPALAFFSLFSFYPIFNAFYTSLFRLNLLSLDPPTFVGFKQYTRLLSSSTFWNSVEATAVFTISTFIPMVVFSLIFAAFISSRRRFQKFMQMAYYSPAVLSSVVAAAIWLLMFDPRGLANQFMNFILNSQGIDYKWLASSGMVRFSTVLVYFWKYVGYFTIIFIAGMASIPKTLHEAARIDGANSWQNFWHITFPLIKPTTLLVSVVAMIQCLKTFSTQYLFVQSGAPRGPIDVITMNIYFTGIRDHSMGTASAMSIILFLIMLLFTWFQLRVSKTEEVTYS